MSFWLSRKNSHPESLYMLSRWKRGFNMCVTDVGTQLHDSTIYGLAGFGRRWRGFELITPG